MDAKKFVEWLEKKQVKLQEYEGETAESQAFVNGAFTALKEIAEKVNEGKFDK